jgi:hypothetical protein
MKINIEKIRIDGDTQSRTSIHEKTVQEYTEVLLDGKKMPPVKLFHDGVDWWLADGFHRYFAHKRAKINELDCDITKGTKRDAKIYSLGANHDHGLPRSHEDKRKSVMTCLDDIELCDLPERKIATICNVSHTLVQRIKKELDLKKDIKAKLSKVALMPEPEPQEEYVDDKMSELVIENKALLKENTQLRDKIAIGQLDVSEEEKIEVEETIESLRVEVDRLQSELDAMTISRNDYQQKASDAIKQVQYWKRRAEKSEKKLK